MAKKYKLTDQHKDELAPWSEKWIANARSTKAMDDADRTAMTGAVNGLYDAANLARPKHIVFVGSPLVALLAGGIAAGMWHLSEHPETWFEADSEQLKATWSAAGEATYDATGDAMRVAIEKRAKKETIFEVRRAIYSAARDASWGTWTILDSVIENVMEAKLAGALAAPMVAPKNVVGVASMATAHVILKDARDEEIGGATQAEEPIPAIIGSCDAANAAFCLAATAAAQMAPQEATQVAIRDAVMAATHSTVPCATHKWAVPFLTRSMATAFDMYDGGSLTFRDVAYLSFFSEVVKLKMPTDEKWRHYLTAAIHGGSRVMHKDFCIVSDRPEILRVDIENLPHCDDGPALRWRDGWELYAIHGIELSAQIVMAPKTLTVQQINNEKNAEVRRIMIERFGFDRYIHESGGRKLHSDDWGTLWQAWAGEPLLIVAVVNSTPEPDGHFKDYWLRVHPQLRPMSNGWAEGNPQPLTALNAVASTFGMSGREYLEYLNDYPQGLEKAQS